MNYEIKNENILYEKILNANLFAGLFEQDFESSFEHPSLEVDYIPKVTNVFDDAVQNHRWDYLIGSIHHIDQMDDGSPWNIDGDLETFRKGLHQIFNDNIVSCTKKFFHYTNDMIELGGFNMIGHFDKIHLNGRFFEGFDYNNTWYKNLMKETLELIKEKGIIVEINTKS